MRPYLRDTIIGTGYALGLITAISALILSVVLLTSCGTLPPANEPGIHLPKACLPEAILMAESLKKIGIPAHILRLGWQDHPTGHALCIYYYKGQVWAWDSYWASIRLTAPLNDPSQLARTWSTITHPTLTIRYAKFE